MLTTVWEARTIARIYQTIALFFIIFYMYENCPINKV